MRIGIVTITRNDRPGLQATLQSVACQTVPPENQIVIDGASTDGTAEWLANESLPAFVSAISEPDRGIYDAMNKGVERVRGDFLIILNSGDCLASDTTLHDIAVDHRRHGWEWAYGDALLVNNAERVGIHRLGLLRRFRFVGGFGTVPHQTVVMSRRLIERVGAFRLDADLSADQEMLLRAWTLASPRRIPAVLTVCDATGVTSNRPPGTFARAMASHRARNDLRIGPAMVDRGVTRTAEYFDVAKRRIKRSLAENTEKL